MGSLTEDRPKCLVELRQKTLLQWQTEALKEAGISDIYIVCGYKKECFPQEGYRFFENPNWETTQMVQSLMEADELLRKEPVIVSYSDIVYHSDIVSKLMQSSADIAISYDSCWQELWKRRFSDPLSDAETFKQSDGLLREIGAEPKSVSEVEGQYMGLLKITPSGWSRLKEMDGVRDLSVTEILQKLIDHQEEIAAVEVAGRWCEVDSAADLELYEQGPNEQHEWV
ncbi:MAG: CTP:phosphoglutamine cytidylyltransferase [Chlamydiales bacterium]|nr:CTP:phosphoglutamine cytidylyltransferase [Chlamydiales bacterium]MCH9634990.1 CTP:phosphoglutamine cytidylyltransferase [Chlamydiales bacterium]